MKRSFRKLVICLALLSLTLSSWATDLRGKVNGYNPYNNSYYPAGGVKVIFSQWNGSFWISVANTYTQRDGMYYIRLNPGNYYIQMPGINLPLIVYNQPSQDVPVLTIPN